MKENKVFEKAIDINASASKIWRVFADPIITRQMGGEYISNWEVGGSLRWKGTDGKFYTNGRILQLEPDKILEHNLFKGDDNGSIVSVIIYRFEENDKGTTLLAREDLSDGLNDKEYADLSEGWDAALNAIKDIAEKL